MVDSNLTGKEGSMKKDLSLSRFDRLLRKVISPRRLERIQHAIAERRRKNAESITVLLANMILDQRIKELRIGY